MFLESLGIRRMSNGKYEVHKYGGFYVVPNLFDAFKVLLFH